MKLGDNVIHEPDGRRGKIVSVMHVEHLDKRKDEDRYVVEYDDGAGHKAQAWFDASDLTVT